MLALIVALVCTPFPSFENFYEQQTGIPYPAMQYEQMSVVNARIANEVAAYMNLAATCVLEKK